MAKILKQLINSEGIEIDRERLKNKNGFS